MRNVILAAILAASAGSPTLVGPAAAETAIFAGGCFWCMEEAFDKAPGVSATISGYSGGSVDNPTYEQVSSGGTGHFEVVQVEYDPAVASYEELLDVFWHNVDPLDPIGQFCDKGSQYLSAIFVANDEERQLAEASLQEVAAELGEEIATQILPEQAFYPAEDYHQDFYQTNSGRYQLYKRGCGRVQRLEQVWGEPHA
jgi:peptide-methionine (S)-S-oxide reductase